MLERWPGAAVGRRGHEWGLGGRQGGPGETGRPQGKTHILCCLGFCLLENALGWMASVVWFSQLVGFVRWGEVLRTSSVRPGGCGQRCEDEREEGVSLGELGPPPARG